MVKNTTDLNGLSISEATKLRDEADELLTRLIVDREMSERRSVESGKRDPMKFITGRTALENAITSTREMIGQLDMLLDRLRADEARIDLPQVHSPPPVAQRTKRPTTRTQHQAAPAAIAS
jgi:hypothetical protein